MKPGNIILFPKWQKVLEEESIAAIKEKKFEEALEKLNNLLTYQVKNHEIYTGKLICLMELERYEEAQELCEALIDAKDKHYYQYIHIYLTLLFQTNQYEALMDLVQDEIERGKIPAQLKEPFKQLYTMSEKMRLNAESEHTNLYLDALYDAVNQDNHMEQWRLINKLSKMSMVPGEKIISLLTNDHIHPLNKSAIYLWLKESKVERPIDIHKFGIHLTLNPVETPEIEDSITAKEVYQAIQEIEHRSPSLFQIVETLFGHYLYVLYPITPPLEDIPYIAEALLAIGNEYLNITIPEPDGQKVQKYIQEIKTSDLLYGSIIDE